MKINLLVYCLLATTPVFAQDKSVSKIAAVNSPAVALAPLRYLASDELKGRGFDRPEIKVAAGYISNQFKHIGVKTVAGAKGYFQPFTLTMRTPGTTGLVTIDNLTFKPGEDALQQQAEDLNLKAPLVYVGHIEPNAITNMDVKGKIVMVDMGVGDKASAERDFMHISDISETLSRKGAVALIERLNGNTGLWAEIKSYLMTNRPDDPSRTNNLPVVIVNNTTPLAALAAKKFTASCSINISGTITKAINLKNVIGYISGTDAKLRSQYILLTSHYDHLGVAKEPKMEEGKMDSIYNGARDNASGTAAVIAAARYFAKYPPKRSVLFITYTAEEEGLIGSAYYATHPLVPLKKTVYNLNIDNASYNDTTLITLVGLGRTSADASIIKACKTYGMHVNNDPLGGSLFAESDNYPLAQKGVPAPTYSLGMKTFDTTITNRYHQLSDEVGNMDLNYVMKFIKAYILAAQYIANDAAQPTWTKNDPLEKEWLKLYK